MNHLPVLPVLVPIVTGALLLLLERRHRTSVLRTWAWIGMLALLAVNVALLVQVQREIGAGVVLIGHDMGLMAQFAHRIQDALCHTLGVAIVDAAEASGDALGAGLAQALRKRLGDAVTFVGVGGPRMAAEGVVSPFDIAELSILGWIEGLLAYGKVKRRGYPYWVGVR